MLKTSKPTQEPAQSGRGGDGTGGEGRGGEGVNKVLQPAKSVRLKASKMNFITCILNCTFQVAESSKILRGPLGHYENNV